jgi:hypothetical protein
MMPGVVTPFLSITHLHTHNEREMEGENVFFRERCSACGERRAPEISQK